MEAVLQSTGAEHSLLGGNVMSMVGPQLTHQHRSIEIFTNEAPAPTHRERQNLPSNVRTQADAAANSFSPMGTNLETNRHSWATAAPVYPSPSASQRSTLRTSVDAVLEDENRRGGHVSGSGFTGRESNGSSGQKGCWEHHGPGSWLSLCSEPGISWVTERTGVPDFVNSAQKLTAAWSVRWKLGENMRQRGDYEPDAATAWKYSDAYFEKCFESIYGVVYRPEFEARLRTHLEHGDPSASDDAAWYALRNTVYAAGCRQVLLKNNATPYADAQAHAWKLFENALAVHTELLYAPTGLQAVQALAAMTFYAESLGNQGFEYMMCANAARLAQAKGLHRHPSKALGLSEIEVAHRNWLFWAIYCCEKQIAFRSGRPSAIDDDNISCEIPIWAPASSTINVEIFTHMIKHARLTAQFEKRLMSVNAFRKSPTELLEASRDLSRQLEDWRNTIAQFHAPRTRIQASSLPPNVRPTHIVYLHFAYYSSLMNIYAIYTSPWISASLGIDRSPSFSEDAVVKSIAVADAARNIILITKDMEVDAAVPQWAAFYYPMAGLINLSWSF